MQLLKNEVALDRFHVSSRNAIEQEVFQQVERTISKDRGIRKSEEAQKTIVIPLSIRGTTNQNSLIL